MNPVAPHPKLLSPRLRLAKYEADYAPAMFAAIEKDRARLRTYLPWVDLIRKVEDEESYIRAAALQWMEFRIFEYGLFSRATNAYVGNIGVHSVSWEDDRAELGYWLTGEAEGHGYMHEAVARLEEELFGLGFHRLEIRCNVLNERSAAVPKRAGYTLEGTLREDVLERGRRRNTMIWGKVRR